jgi:hypothetical protein
MPASRSPGRDTKATPQPRSYWPIVLIGFAALLAVIIATLPASMVAHFLPPGVRAEDYSGTVWHGSAGKISVNAHDAGALEWRLHPAALLGAALAADLHWVKAGFVIDAAVKIDRQGVTLRGIKGGGSVEDLNDFGFAAGWRGDAAIDFSELKSDFAKPLAAVGDIRVSNLTSARIAGGADLGSYDLRLPEGAVGSDGNVSAQLMDSGGPLDVQAVLHYSAKERTGILTGTIKERADAPSVLRGLLENLSQLRVRDPQGRIPVDLEFAL